MQKLDFFWPLNPVRASYPLMSHSFSFKLFFLGMLAFVQCFAGANFHLILVGDFEEDELARKVFVQKDLAGIREEAYLVANALNLPVIETVFEGAVSAQGVLDLAESCFVQPEDVVVFYFSGHGISLFSQVDDPWPNLLCSGDDQAFALSLLIALFEEKNARFTFIFTDCCNTPLPDDLLSQPLLRPKRLYEARAIENYKKLFQDTPGMVVLCAAKKKQMAHASSAGSLCTTSFLEALHEKVSDYNKINWQEVLDTTTHKLSVLAKGYRKVQTPLFLIQE